jgi:hypothetical protein
MPSAAKSIFHDNRRVRLEALVMQILSSSRDKSKHKSPAKFLFSMLSYQKALLILENLFNQIIWRYQHTGIQEKQAAIQTSTSHM